MRVVAGTARGRILRPPAGVATRPTSDRVREAMFDMLSSMDVLDGAAVADLFAGSGALGIEALSRGAASVEFVDDDRSAVSAIRANLDAVAPDASATVRCAEALAWAGAPGRPVMDLVMADPPYRWEHWPELLASLAGSAGLVVAETGREWAPGDGWEVVRQRRYGTTFVTIARPERPVTRGGA